MASIMRVSRAALVSTVGTLRSVQPMSQAGRRSIAMLNNRTNVFSIAAARRGYAQDIKSQTPQEIEARVLKACKDFDKLASNAEKVTLTASFVKDLGLDSLDRIELMMAFEDEFGFEIPEAEAEKLQTPGDIVKYIVNKK